jgi:hypothetical protein
MVGIDLVQRHRHARQLRVQQAHRIVGHERLAAGEQLVKAGAERVEVAAVVDVEVGAAGLLGRHVLQRAGHGGAIGAARLDVERVDRPKSHSLIASVTGSTSTFLGASRRGSGDAVHRADRLGEADRQRELVGHIEQAGARSAAPDWSRRSPRAPAPGRDRPRAAPARGSPAASRSGPGSRTRVASAPRAPAPAADCRGTSALKSRQLHRSSALNDLR